MNRREFLSKSLQGTAVLSAASLPINSLASSKKTMQKGSGFTMWQLNTQCNEIGNSYVFLTREGQVVVMDGGCSKDEYYLRGFLAHMGNHVHTWFISHPHSDHMDSLISILKEPRGITINRIVHSPFTEDLINSEPDYAAHCRHFYHLLLQVNNIEIVELNSPGWTEDIGGLNFKILGVSNPEIIHNGYNNSSMIIKVWDKKKSILFLADAGEECGDKLLSSPFRQELDCDYVQMAHHGQRGCRQSFYQSIHFRACLWSTPQWVWDNNTGNGPGTGHLKTEETRQWMKEKGITEHHVSWKGLYQLD